MSTAMMSEFSEKVVLVTGAGSGIGRAIATAFAVQEAFVAANDITPINLDGMIAQISEFEGQAKAYVADVAKKMPVQLMVEEILENWGRIDILVNNARVAPQTPLLELDEWDWHRTLDVNLTGAFLTIQSVGRAMRAQGGGVIVNISSTAGQVGGLPDRSAFVASMQGLIGLTRVAAQELAPYHIRVNAVCPGLIETDMTAQQRQDVTWQASSLLAIPQGRRGTPEDVAGAVLMLCTQACSHLTGQSINVDGGQIMP
jgi:NAD(P)-dependent dehydrogenase (short-subunit alcohol dehydrogenase family)